MKGGMTIPNIRSLDPGTCESYIKCAQVCRLSNVNCLLSYGVQFLVGSTSLVVCMFGVEDFEFTGMVSFATATARVFCPPRFVERFF